MILYPLRARSFITRTRAKIIVVITWVVSLILGIPGLVLQVRHQNHKTIVMTEQWEIVFVNIDVFHGLFSDHHCPLVSKGNWLSYGVVRLYASENLIYPFHNCKLRVKLQVKLPLTA